MKTYEEVERGFLAELEKFFSCEKTDEAVLVKAISEYFLGIDRLLKLEKGGACSQAAGPVKAAALEKLSEITRSTFDESAQSVYKEIKDILDTVVVSASYIG